MALLGRLLSEISDGIIMTSGTNTSNCHLLDFWWFSVLLVQSGSGCTWTLIDLSVKKYPSRRVLSSCVIESSEKRKGERDIETTPHFLDFLKQFRLNNDTRPLPEFLPQVSTEKNTPPNGQKNLCIILQVLYGIFNGTLLGFVKHNYKRSHSFKKKKVCSWLACLRSRKN